MLRRIDGAESIELDMQAAVAIDEDITGKNSPVVYTSFVGVPGCIEQVLKSACGFNHTQLSITDTEELIKSDQAVVISSIWSDYTEAPKIIIRD